MTDEIGTSELEPKTSSKRPLVIAFVVACLVGGGAFFATWSGLILGSDETAQNPSQTAKMNSMPDIAFVELEPLVVSITGSDEMSHLRFRAQLEVPSAYKEDVQLLHPRIIDVLNGYLRALRTSDIEDTSALARLRAQMLRRVQVVVGPDRINDLLIMEFVIN